MPILQKDKSLKDNSLQRDKHLQSGDNNPSNDRLLPKGENSYDTLFFPEEKTENMSIISLITLSDMEKSICLSPNLSITTLMVMGIARPLPSLSIRRLIVYLFKMPWILVLLFGSI